MVTRQVGLLGLEAVTLPEVTYLNLKQGKKYAGSYSLILQTMRAEDGTWGKSSSTNYYKRDE